MTTYGIGSLRQIDNLDDRRESFHLFCKLTQAERVRFLNELIQKHKLPIHAYSEVDTPHESWLDLMLMSAQYFVPPADALVELEAFVRRLGR